MSEQELGEYDQLDIIMLRLTERNILPRLTRVDATTEIRSLITKAVAAARQEELERLRDFNADHLVYRERLNAVISHRIATLEAETEGE